MNTMQILYVVFLFVIGGIIISRDRKKSQRVLELDKKYIKVLEDLYTFEKELKSLGVSDEEIHTLKNKYKPEDGEFDSEFTDWKKALFGN